MYQHIIKMECGFPSESTEIILKEDRHSLSLSACFRQLINATIDLEKNEQLDVTTCAQDFQWQQNALQTVQETDEMTDVLEYANNQSGEDPVLPADGISAESKLVSVTATSNLSSTVLPLLSSPNQNIRVRTTRKEYLEEAVDHSELIGPLSTAIGLKAHHFYFAVSSCDGLKLSNEKLTNGLVLELYRYLRDSPNFRSQPSSHLLRIIALHFDYKGIKHDQISVQRNLERKVLEPMLNKWHELQSTFPRPPADDLILFNSQVFQIPPSFLEGHKTVTRKPSFSSFPSSRSTESGNRRRKDKANLATIQQKNTTQQLIHIKKMVQTLRKHQITHTRRQEFLCSTLRSLRHLVDHFGKFLRFRSFR